MDPDMFIRATTSSTCSGTRPATATGRTLLMSGEIHLKVSVENSPAVASGLGVPSAASSAGTPVSGCSGTQIISF